jgi:hypothetical protein
MEKNVVRTLLGLFIFALLLSACNLGRDLEEAPFPEVSTPAATEQTMPPEELTLTPEPEVIVTEATEPTPTATLLPSEPILGLQFNQLPPPEQIALLPRPDILWMRTNLIFWDQIEPQRTDPPTYDWSVIDEAALANAGESGIEILLVVQFAPEWAQRYPPSACGPIAEESLERFGQFMNALVSRYSQPPYNIHHWEIGNEQDVAREDVQPRSVYGCWGERNDPYFGGGYYGEMLKATYPQVKAADPESQVIVGGLLLDCDPANPPEREPGVLRNCSPGQFLEGILVNGGGDFFDGVSFHSYDFYMGELGKYANGNWFSSWDTTGPSLIAKTRFLRDVLSRYGYEDKLLLNTEMALICGRDGSEPECQTEEYQLTKAYYLPQSAITGMAVGLDANTWYSLFGWRGSRLVTQELEPLPVFEALLTASERLDRSIFVGEITDFPGVQVYEYERDGARNWLLWSKDGADHPVSLPEMPASVMDAFGDELQPSQELTITKVPVFIHWSP